VSGPAGVWHNDADRESYGLGHNGRGRCRTWSANPSSDAMHNNR
jgi:hypothetical protein